jgi:methyl-accepting chemotaxis protein
MKNLSLNKKIIGLISIFIIGNIIIAFVGIKNVMIIDEHLNDLFEVTNERVMLAKDMDSLVNQLRNKEKVFILDENPEAMKKNGELIDDIKKKITGKIESFKMIASEEGKKDLNLLETDLREWKVIDSEMRILGHEGKKKEATDIATGKSREKLEEFENVLNGLVTKNEQLMKQDITETGKLVDSTRNIIFIVSICALLIGGFVAWFIMNMMSMAINKVITSLNESTNQVSSASTQIATSAQELSQATTEQAASLEETAASVEEMSSMITKNSDNAKVASESSHTSQMNAMKGKDTIDEMIQAIDEINESNTKIMDQINHSNDQLGDIVKVISEIETKTKVINDIVFQTKLLSFNASVEAARAGEHGKGFAVVAEEVGNLAAMSGNAAKEISTMLDSSIKKVETIVHETKYSVDKLIAEGKSKVEKGTRVAQSCGVVLEEIVTNINKVNDLAGEISTASEEQAHGINEITKAMHQLDQVTQQNASATEQTASAAEQLSAQAESLKATVGVLVATIHGSAIKNKVFIKPSKPVVKQPEPLAPVKNVVKLEAKKVETTKKHVAESPIEKAPSYDDVRFKDV